MHSGYIKQAHRAISSVALQAPTRKDLPQQPSAPSSHQRPLHNQRRKPPGKPSLKKHLSNWNISYPYLLFSINKPPQKIGKGSTRPSPKEGTQEKKEPKDTENCVSLTSLRVKTDLKQTNHYFSGQEINTLSQSNAITDHRPTGSTDFSPLPQKEKPASSLDLKVDTSLLASDQTISGAKQDPNKRNNWRKNVSIRFNSTSKCYRYFFSSHLLLHLLIFLVLCKKDYGCG